MKFTVDLTDQEVAALERRHLPRLLELAATGCEATPEDIGIAKVVRAARDAQKGPA